MLLFLVLLGVVAWIVISVPIALLLVQVFNLEEGEPSPSSMPGDLELECMDLTRPEVALDWAGSTDQLAGAG